MPALPSWASFGATWAPTVARDAAGRYVMFYAALDAATGTECVGEADSASPTGPFVDANSGPVICDPAGGGDIDPYIFADPSTRQDYLIWKLNANIVGEPTSLWATTLSPNFTITGTPTQLLTDDQSWQAGNIEGPAMVEEDGTYLPVLQRKRLQQPELRHRLRHLHVASRPVRRQRQQSGDRQPGGDVRSRRPVFVLRAHRIGDELFRVGGDGRLRRRGVSSHVHRIAHFPTWRSTL